MQLVKKTSFVSKMEARVSLYAIDGDVVEGLRRWSMWAEVYYGVRGVAICRYATHDMAGTYCLMNML